MATSLEDAEAQISNMKLKLQRKKIEIRSLKKALKIVSNGSDSHQDSTEDDLDTEDSDDKGDDEESDDEDDDSDDDDGEDLPIPTQSYECKDIYLCSDQACGGEVTDGYCFLCRKKHQIMKDENMASTESQLEHPDRCMAPRGNTPLQSISKDDSPLPALYESRAREYRSLLRRGATPEMCELFKLEFTYANGIVARVTEDLFEEFAGLPMDECDDWKIYLGRRLTLAKDDIDGYEFIESILDEISVLPGIGNWVTEEEEAGVWVTYPKHSGQVESQPRDILDSVDIAAENIVPPNQSNDYELSDDDSEQDDVEMEEPMYTMEEPMYTTTGGISYLHADRWYIPSDEEEDMLESDSGGEQQLDELAGDDDHDEHTTMTDSGSDFHSDEMFSGDEEILRIKFGGPSAQVGNGNATMI